MSERLTIQDIARLAGVSKATVSRVLNHKPDVDALTRQRVMRIMDEYAFVPSITASGLAGGRRGMIGVLVPALTWHFIPEVVQGVAEVVERSAYELLLYSISQQENRKAVLDRILDTKLTAGLLAVEPGSFVERLTQWAEGNFPVVLIDDQHVPANTPWVGVDNRMGAAAAVRHLIGLGHRRIAHIRGPLQYQCSQERYQGYQQAMVEAGLALDPAFVLQGDFQVASGHACASTLLTLAERPSAIFAANDHMAWGVLEFAGAHGLRVPEDIAVVGFDDTPPSQYKHPPLTTVRQPFQEMGQRAAELLLWLIDLPHNGGEERRKTLLSLEPPLPFPGYNAPLHIQLKTSLIIRQSCGAQQLASIAGV
ncbi:MAG TPA: LacI family DNA-binding transcriptional regulator [Ktedonobacterales bacterium]|jgi:LacI family transcriptional regulator